MKVLIGCEFSRIVARKFEKKGHYVMSCDLRQPLVPGNHFHGNIKDIMYSGWDMLIAFPPCTYLTVAGNRWLNIPGRKKKIEEAIKFVQLLMDSPIKQIAIENPVGVLSTRIRKPDQIIQPYYFGDNIPKKVCLWLKNLRPLIWYEKDSLFKNISKEVEPEYLIYNSKSKKQGFSRYSKFGKLRGSEETTIKRSMFFEGIAMAMAEQWG